MCEREPGKLHAHLELSPTAVGRGTLVIHYRWTNELKPPQSGTLSIPYAGTSDDNVVASASPAGAVAALVGAGQQSVAVSFTTDDGSAASALAVTTNLATLPSGWSSGSTSFGCATVSTGNGCELALSYAPASAGSGTLTLLYTYTDNAGNPRSGGINIPYAATTSDNVVGTASPSGQIAVTVGGSQAVAVSFTTDDGNAASGLLITATSALCRAAGTPRPTASVARA